MKFYKNFKGLVPSSKKDLSYNKFFEYYKRKSRLTGANCNDDVDNIIKEIYYMSDEDYSKWYNTITRISVSFVKENSELIQSFIKLEEGNKQLDLIFDMYCFKRTIISKTMPDRVCSGMNNERQKVYLEAYNDYIDELIIDDNNILYNAKKKFREKYGKYKKDPIIGNYYVGILNDFQKDMLDAALDEMNKVKIYKEHDEMCSMLSHIADYNLKRKRRDNRIK